MCFTEPIRNSSMTVLSKLINLLTSSSLSSPARFVRSTSAFLRTKFEYLLPTPLMAVIANMIFVFPSMFVFITRRMCWNFSGTTRDWKWKYLINNQHYGMNKFTCKVTNQSWLPKKPTWHSIIDSSHDSRKQQMTLSACATLTLPITSYKLHCMQWDRN